MNSPIRRGRFILAWFVTGIAVLPLSAALSFAALFAISGIIYSLNDFAPWFIVDDLLFALALVWLINGFCIGCLQKAVVKRYLRVDLGSWQVFSTLGALLAGVLVYPCLEDGCFLSQFYDTGFASPIYVHIESPVVVAIYLTVFSAVQCLALNRIAKACWRWVAAHFGSLLLALLASTTAVNESSAVFDVAMQFLALYTLVITLVTGFVMLRMFSSPRGASKDGYDEWSYQPAPPEPPTAHAPVRQVDESG